jgi:CheY-like chemotaxis protein
MDNHCHRLLIVDDDPNMILLARDYLELKGFSVATAENGLQGIALLEQESPDLIICDMMMPGMNGYSFVERVKANPKTKKIPVLFLSASSKAKDQADGLKVGAEAYMLKPFDPEELVAKVNHILESKACSNGASLL